MNDDIESGSQETRKELGEVSATSRGFPLVRFSDSYGSACTLSASSLIGDYDHSFDRPGSSCVWLGVAEVKPIVMARDAKNVGVETDETTGWVPFPVPTEVSLNSLMHLDREQVEGLIHRLQQWLLTADFDGKAAALQLVPAEQTLRARIDAEIEGATAFAGLAERTGNERLALEAHAILLAMDRVLNPQSEIRDPQSE